jgi:Ca-activated chloride channel family protein
VIDWTQFHFLRPDWFWALVPLGLLAGALLWRLRQGDGWRAVCDAHLLRHLLVGRAERRRTLPLVLLSLAWLVAVLALAGPTWSQTPQPVFRTTDARVIVMDLSRSMDAGDVNPSRLQRARFKVADILERSGEGHTGLIAFAGDAFVVSPLTEDANTIAALLPALATSVMPAQGSRLDRGISKATELLIQAGFSAGNILVIADGGADDRARKAAAEAAGRGYRVSVMSIGTPEGAPVPLPDGDFLKDSSGNIVIPRVDHGALKDLAADGRGRYTPMTPDARDLDYLLATESADAFDMEATAVNETSDAWAEQGPWLVLLLLPLVALTFRRGWVFSVMFLALGLTPRADAANWNDLWLRPDQQAARALAEERVEDAVQVARDPAWRGTAEYRAGAFEEAAVDFSALESADAHYNRGNAMAHAGNLEGAIAAYDEALKRNPEHEDAVFNRELLEQLKQQQDQQQQGQEGESSEQQDGEEQEGQDQTTEGEQQQQQGEQGESSDEESEQEQEEGEFADAEPQYQDAPPEFGEFEESELTPEERQAMEQWLRAIPDDPGGLLRRKFLREYQRRARRGEDVYSGW